MSRRLSKKLIDAQTALNTAGYVGISEIAQIDESGFHIEFSSGSAAGQVVIETSSDPAYTGTWAILSTINWAAASKSHYVAITGVFRALRVRISSAITTGTVDVWMSGNIT